MPTYSTSMPTPNETPTRVNSSERKLRIGRRDMLLEVAVNMDSSLCTSVHVYSLSGTNDASPRAVSYRYRGPLLPHAGCILPYSGWVFPREGIKAKWRKGRRHEAVVK